MRHESRPLWYWQDPDAAVNRASASSCIPDSEWALHRIARTTPARYRTEKNMAVDSIMNARDAWVGVFSSTRSTNARAGGSR